MPRGMKRGPRGPMPPRMRGRGRMPGPAGPSRLPGPMMKPGIFGMFPIGLIIMVAAFLIGGKALLPLLVIGVLVLGGGGFFMFGPMRRMGMMAHMDQDPYNAGYEAAYDDPYYDEDKPKRGESSE